VPAAQSSPVLYVIACGGPPARQLPGFVGPAKEQGWDVCVIATPDGTKFLDTDRLTELTGHPVRSQYKAADDPDVLPPADAFVVAPASFNTVNKWALGISDTLALGLLCEAVGLDLPMAAAPWPNAPLARHPAFQRSLAALRDWGVRVIFDPAGLPGVAGGGRPFPWADLLAALPALRR
jgi:phosphopantothenoylcysteine synthetase/decarboxylase